MRVSKEVNPPGEDPSKGAKTVSVRAKTEEHMEQLHLPHHHGAEAQIPALCRELEKTEKFQTIADVFRQLGDPTRVRIFWLLCHCEPCVVNISAMMDMSSPAISHHLRALKASGLIVSRREGKEVYYAGKLAVWKEAGFQEGTITPDDGFCGLLVRVDLRKLTEQPPECLSGADVTGERLYDLYCVREDMTLLPADAQTDAIVDMFYAKPAQTVRAWQRLGAQALLLQLGAVQTDGDMAQEELSEQVRAVHAVHAYLTQNLETRVTIEELSKQYLMNPTTLKQVFKSVYGTSLAAHMKEHRMGRAAQLLRETDESVAEIARAVGYESQSKFTAAFKEYFGALPKEYRKNH